MVGAAGRLDWDDLSETETEGWACAGICCLLESFWNVLAAFRKL